MTRIRTDLQIRGWVDLRSALRDINDRLPKELGDVNYDVAEFVIDRAAGRASTPLERRAARSMTAARQQRVSLIRLGGNRYPEALGAEFGAGHNTLRNTTRGLIQGWNQFRPWRGNSGDAGYFLMPTIRDDTPEIIEHYYDRLDALTRRAFPQ